MTVSPALASVQPDFRAVGEPARTLSFYRCEGASGPSVHDLRTRLAVAESIADLLGFEVDGGSSVDAPPAPGAYFVPSDTLCGLDTARRLGICGPADLFGGVVPFRFVATKLVTHGLVGAEADAPSGWAPGLAHALGSNVLPGYSVFSKDDAREAGATLLRHGPVRIKDAGGIGGSGQSVAESAGELDAQIDAIGPARFAGGFVIERNLTQVSTCSVGRVCVGPWTASYAGHQRTTRNHQGKEVYGGSSLTVVRGDFDDLMRLSLSAPIRLAVEQARQYHEAMHQAYAGMFASRCNYDIAQGFDAEGRWQSGVLEQSWRIGGCSAAEIAALWAFKKHDMDVVSASTHEIYGDAVVPRGAWLLFDGVDESAERLVKYARIRASVHA